MNQSLRNLFPITESYVYLNHAAVSPPSTLTVNAATKQIDDVHRSGSMNFRDWIHAKDAARAFLCQLLAVRTDQLAFMRNTSDGLSTIANGLAWRSGDNIVTFRGEFPANIYPWLHAHEKFGVEVRFAEERDGRVDIDELIALIDERTRIVAISHVQFSSGFRMDLQRLGAAVRKRDALFVVDVIQSLGALEFDVNDALIDVAAFACHKWLMGLEGVGALYLSDRARERLTPTLVGWTSVPQPEDYGNHEQGWRSGALVWETGTGPSALFCGLAASLELLTSIGIKQIEAHLFDLGDYLCERLAGSRYDIVSSRLPAERSQIVCVRNRDGIPAHKLYHQLIERRIVTAPRMNRLRISPHLYNTTAEIDALVESLP